MGKGIGLGTFIWIGVLAWFFFGLDTGEIVNDVASWLSDNNISKDITFKFTYGNISNNVVDTVTISAEDIPELHEDFGIVNPPEKDTWNGLGFE